MWVRDVWDWGFFFGDDGGVLRVGGVPASGQVGDVPHGPEGGAVHGVFAHGLQLVVELLVLFGGTGLDHRHLGVVVDRGVLVGVHGVRGVLLYQPCQAARRCQLLGPQELACVVALAHRDAHGCRVIGQLACA